MCHDPRLVSAAIDLLALLIWNSDPLYCCCASVCYEVFQHIITSSSSSRMQMRLTGHISLNQCLPQVCIPPRRVSCEAAKYAQILTAIADCGLVQCRSHLPCHLSDSAVKTSNIILDTGDYFE